MKEFELQQLLAHPALVDERISEYRAQTIIREQREDPSEILGHIEKADHNLRFVAKNTELEFLDCALAARAECIITGDKDLLVLNPSYGIRILAPAEFLHDYSRK